MEAARAMAQGIENADHDAEVRCLPMADGGEGTARALVDATGGSMRAVPVHDPLGRPVEGHCISSSRCFVFEVVTFSWTP